MDLTISAPLNDLLKRIRAFVAEVLIPGETMLRDTQEWSRLEPQLEALRDQVRREGLWAPWLPKDHGGLGLSLREYAHVSEELGRSPIGHYVFHCQAPDVGNIELLLEHGTPEQKSRWLAPLCAGKIRSCFSMTEPDLAGSNPVEMATTARRDGGSWVIDGHKWFTTAADGAAFAIVMANTNAQGGPYERASMIIVPCDTPGFELVRNISVMGEPGGGWASHGEIRYTNVRVPVGNLLGPENAGFMLAQQRLGPGRIHHCMRWIGIAERAFDMMCQRAARRQLSPGKALGTRQTVQNWIAESRADIDAARLLVLHTAHMIDAQGVYASRERISVIKFHAAAMLQNVLDRAIQVHGALGMTDDTPLAWWYRHERAARIYDGPDEVHKSTVAKRILRGHGLHAG